MRYSESCAFLGKSVSWGVFSDWKISVFREVMLLEFKLFSKNVYAIYCMCVCIQSSVVLLTPRNEQWCHVVDYGQSEGGKCSPLTEKTGPVVTCLVPRCVTALCTELYLCIEHYLFFIFLPFYLNVCIWQLQLWSWWLLC